MNVERKIEIVGYVVDDEKSETKTTTITVGGAEVPGVMDWNLGFKPGCQWPVLTLQILLDHTVTVNLGKEVATCDPSS